MNKQNSKKQKQDRLAQALRNNLRRRKAASTSPSQENSTQLSPDKKDDNSPVTPKAESNRKQ